MSAPDTPRAFVEVAAVSHELALRIVQLAIAEGAATGLPVAIAVADPAMALVAYARADGTTEVGLAAQTECVFDNIEAMLAAAEMDLRHLVKLTIFCVAPGDPKLVREVRNRRLGSHAPASTVVLVAGLANPDYLIEIEGEALEEA